MRVIRMVLALAWTLCLPLGATAQEAYLELPGIIGDVTSLGYEDHVEVLEFHHLVTGAGAANHEPIIFVKKRKERSTVDLLQRLDSGAKVDAVFKFTEDFGVNGVKTVLEAQLIGGKVVAIEPWSRNGADGSDEFERVRMEYQDLKVIHREYDQTGGLLNTESHTLSKPN